MKKTKPPQVDPAKKVAALKARVEAAKPRLTDRLLSKVEVLAIANCTYPTLWDWMCKGKFPRSRIVAGRSMWLSDEVDRWLAELPVRPLKGDATEENTAA
jgi:predicted DNA-binding transcriptional regulator AlpA